MPCPEQLLLDTTPASGDDENSDFYPFIQERKSFLSKQKAQAEPFPLTSDAVSILHAIGNFCPFAKQSPKSITVHAKGTGQCKNCPTGLC